MQDPLKKKKVVQQWLVIGQTFGTRLAIGMPFKFGNYTIAKCVSTGTNEFF